MKNKHILRRLISILLVFIMMLGILPMSALAADTCTVSVYSTALDLTFQSPEGQVIAPVKSISGNYQVYTLRDVPVGIYTYASEQYGSGVLKLSGDEDVYLRVVDFSFREKGSPFYMTVTNTKDEALVYTSPRTSKLSTELLVPALGWGVTYRYDFCPDEGWCSFFGLLWVLENTSVLDGFKTTAYNLSDGGAYLMGREKEVTFRVPEGAKLNVYELVKFYRAPSEYHTRYIGAEDGYDVYKATVSSTNGGNYYYTVSKKDCITTSAIFYATDGTITVGPNAIEGDPHQQVKQSYAASVVTNGNRAKFISLEPGGEFAIWSSRAWQAIDTITSNRYVEPDKHYYVVSGDAVTVDDIGTVTAVKEGTAIVAMTYDAMNYQGDLYSAIDSDSVAVFVFTVGGNQEGITTGLVNSTDLDTHYVASDVTMDGKAQPIETNSSVHHTFTPTDADNEEISVQVCTVYGYPTPVMSEWRGYQADADGAFTIDLYPGRNVVEISAGSRKAYHVLNCKSANVKITNNSASGETPKQDESVTVHFNGIITPTPKLGAIYNPGFGGTVYLEGTLNRPDGGTETVTSQGVQYSIGDSAAINVPLAASGDYSLTGLRIHSGSFGAAPSTHLILSRQSESGFYDGGDSPEITGYFSYLPVISFPAENADHEATAAAVRALIDDIGEITYTPECLEKLKTARAAYDSASAAVKALITEGQVKVLTDGEKAYAGLEEADVASKIKTKTIDTQDFYVLTNAAELKWFAKVVNGALASGAPADPTVNAILGNDITVNEDLLSEDFQLMTSGAEQWKSMGADAAPYAGIFDGDGFSINGIYQYADAGSGAGLFAANAGTICNLMVGDSYLTTASKNIGGIASSNTESGVIENVTFRGYVGNNSGVGSSAGGITSNNSGVIRGCRTEGKVDSSDIAGGIVCYSSLGSVSHCVNAGAVSGKKAAGIVLTMNSGSVTACYTSAEAQVKGVDGAAGIVYQISRASIGSCYNAGSVLADKADGSGIYCEAESRGASTTGICYYLYGTASGGIIQGCVERKTLAQFAGGEIAYLLGGEYGQHLGADAYPVFNNGSNRVFLVDGGYVNASAGTVDKLIGALGNVALDGSPNCFAQVMEAKNAFDSLSEEEQANVTETAALTQKISDYDDAVSQLNGLIAALATITAESGADVEAAKTAYQNYQIRGGDPSRIINADRITEAEDEYFQFRLEEIGSSIATRTVNGAEYYVLTDADELYWFAGLVNGTLPGGGPAVANANVLLENDIVVNPDLLGTILAGGVNVRQDSAAMQRKWTPIKVYSGILDGGGHAISGLCMVGARESALFRELKNATIKNLTIEDAYFRGNDVAAGITIYMNGNSILERCAFTGVVACNFMRAGGLIVYLDGGEVRNCYAQGTVSVETDLLDQTFSGGIAAVANGTGVIANSYVACDFTLVSAAGAILGRAQNSGFIIKNCYFETNDTVDVAISINAGNVDTSSAFASEADQFSCGEVAYRLGGAFGQDLASDVYPVFNNGANTVYYVNGNYYNRTLQVVKLMIDAIGAVALDGDEDCFRKTAEAQQAFGDLSAAMQNAIGPAYRNKLQQANDSYAAVVTALNEDILAIRPLSKWDRDGKYNAFSAKLEQYSSRGGDIGRISNYILLPDIKAELDEQMLLWCQEDVEETIQTRAIEGKEYYVLRDANDLDWFINLVNGTLKTETEGNAAANAVLGNSIILNQHLISAIVSDDSIDAEKAAACRASLGMTSYGGVFDGAGYAISGLYLPSGTFCGTLAEGGCIENLQVTDAVIRNGNGGIVKTVSDGAQVSGCTFSGALFGTTDNCGGIAGEVKGNASVKNCIVSGLISSSRKYVGGIVGVNSGEIMACGASGVTAVSNTTQPYVGGVAGQNKAGGIIQDCYARGKAQGTHVLGQYIGGVTGGNSGTVTNCYSAAFITTSAKANCGGVSGANTNGTISNCYYQVGSTGDFKGIGKNDDVVGRAESRTYVQFADGTVTAALNGDIGDAFVQHGDYPELKGRVSTYPLTVVSGADMTNAGPYAAGTAINIKADPEPVGKVFDKWTANVEGVVFDNASAAETTVIMPDSDVTVTANYRESSGDVWDGYVTISVQDNAIRVAGESGILHPEPLGTIVTGTQVPYKDGETIADVTLRLLEDKGITCKYSSAPSGFYMYSIEDFTVDGQTIDKLGEMDCGAGSGWMVTLNNWFINRSASMFEVEAGDIIKWQYTCQYGKDIGHDWDNPSAEITGLNFEQNYGELSPAFSEEVENYIYIVPASVKEICLEGLQANYWASLTYTSGGKLFKPMEAIPVENGTVIVLDCAYYNNYDDSKPTDTDRLTITIQVVGAEEENSVILTPEVEAAEGTVAVKLTEEELAGAIAAVKEEGEYITVRPQITGEAAQVTLELPKVSLTEMASQTDAGLVVETPVGNLTIPHEALASIAEQAEGDTVTISLESVDNATLTPAQQEAVGDKPVFEIIIKSGDKKISNFNGGQLTISLPCTLKDRETAEEVKVWYLNEAGELEEITCTYDATTGLATFTTDHLSYYTVGVAEKETEIGQVTRTAGDNRYDTSAQTALNAYPEGAKTVIIARGDDQGDFADALAASYLAGVENAPILLTAPGSLPQEIEAAIKQLGATKAYVLGGELAVSQGVVSKLKTLGLETERITGNNRYATAAAIAAKGGPADTAIVVSGTAPADSLVAGPLAFSSKCPILLVDKNSVPAETKQAIADLGITKIIVIGGENVVSKAVYNELKAQERYAGQSRIETSLDVAEKAYKDAKDFSIVGYLKLADAVGAAVNGDPIIYVKDNIADVQNYLTGASTASTSFNIFGGPLAVNSTVENELKGLLK